MKTNYTYNSAQLIGLDWGSTGLRAFLLGADAQILEARSDALGASKMKSPADYIQTLHTMVGDWMLERPDLRIVACGMVGSQHGWQEVPYATCPSSQEQLAAQLMAVAGQPVHIVPGVLYSPEAAPPDVMRGEETQVAGALHRCPDLTEQSFIVLPGTHSKWVDVQQGKVTRFATHMTGELFAVLRHHSVLGRLIPQVTTNIQDSATNEIDLPAFLKGVDVVRNAPVGGLTHQLFAVRTLGLTRQMAPESLADYLSGMLIGHEIQSGLDWIKSARKSIDQLTLVGEQPLCDRYCHALQRFDQMNTRMLPNTAPAGLWRLAMTAKLISTAHNQSKGHRNDLC